MTSAKRKMPIKTAEIKLEGDWEGWNFTARTNPTLGTFADAASGDFDRMAAALSAMVTGWDFVDEEGNPLPQPKEEGATSLLPLDLTSTVISSIMDRIAKLPNG